MPAKRDRSTVDIAEKFRLGYIFTACILTLSILIGPTPALAHGVGYRMSDKKAVPLEFYYSTGETMAYQETLVFSPLDSKNSYQSGRTDEFGRYSFIPESEGEWRVVVKDHEGHRAEAAIQITGDFFSGLDASPKGLTSSQPSLPQGSELFWRAVLGVSILFNIAALARARTKKEAHG
jgi:nickel transport protein